MRGMGQIDFLVKTFVDWFDCVTSVETCCSMETCFTSSRFKNLSGVLLRSAFFVRCSSDCLIAVKFRVAQAQSLA